MNEQRRKFISNIHANLVFRCESRFEVFQDTWHSNREDPSVSLACLPVLSLDALKLCRFLSRSDLVLNAD